MSSTVAKWDDSRKVKIKPQTTGTKMHLSANYSGLNWNQSILE